MPRKKNEMYGRKYKACPCAQIVQRDTSYNYDLVEPTCYSPKRDRPKRINGRDWDQIRICIGGTSHGKRYTSCPYYVRNADIGVESTVRRSTLGGWIADLFMPIFFFAVAVLLLKQGGYANNGAALFFAALGIILFMGKFRKKDNIVGKKRRKR